MACNNGLEWKEAAREAIDRTGFGSQVTWEHSVQDVREALCKLYGTEEISLQQLSATFRRGDLTEKLHEGRTSAVA